MSSKDKKLLVVAVLCLVVAGALLAWNMGWFEGRPSPSSTPPVQTDDTGQPKGGPQQAPPPVG